MAFRMRDTPANRRHNAKLLHEWITERERRWRTFTATVPNGIDNKRLAGHVRNTFDGKVNDVAVRQKGDRNTWLNIKTFQLGAFVNEGLLDRTAVEDAMFSASVTNGHVRDDGDMARKTIMSALDGAARKHTVPTLPAYLWETTTVTDAEFDDDEAAASTTELETIEDGFWDARDTLKTIHTAALARMCSPWAVLACCAAQALAMVPPDVVLPPLIGGGGSLNWFGALAAISGGGKGAALDVADELIKPVVPVYQRNIGSGEGMVDMYKRPANQETDEPAGVRESIMFVADEIDTFAAMKNQSGSTMTGTLRSAFTGKMLGSSTVRSSGFHLIAHEYRLTCWWVFNRHGRPAFSMTTWPVRRSSSCGSRPPTHGSVRSVPHSPAR